MIPARKTAFESKGPQPPESNRATRAVRVIKQSIFFCGVKAPRCARNQTFRRAAREIKFRAARGIKSKGPPGGYFCAVFRPA